MVSTMKRRVSYWNSTTRRFFAITTLIVGHLLWIFFGHSKSNRWYNLLNILSAPSNAISAKIYQWKAYRQQRLTNLKQAQIEIASLKAQLTELLIDKEKQAAKLAETEDAIKILGLKRLLPLNLKTARVIANTHKAPLGGFIIDNGKDDNLVPDQGVICPEGVVGRIWEVGNNYSSILPLDAYNASTGVMLARSRATGVLQGLGAGKATIRYINKQEVVQVGEPVYTSGLDQIFPRGLLVGHVSAVKYHDIELNIEVVLAAQLDRIWLVLVLVPHPQLEIKPLTNLALLSKINKSRSKND